MKVARSSLRFGVIVAAVTSLASGVGLFVGCGSDEEELDADPTSSDKKKDGSAGNDATNPLGDSGGNGDACAQADASVGQVCDGDASTCPCNLTCVATRCVPRAACNEALLSWNGPTENGDGTCLRDLAGFAIHSGPDAAGGPYPNVFDAGVPCVNVGTIACGDAGETAPDLRCSYRLTGLTNGVWSFVVTAYTDAGVESPVSGEASKNIACP